jgi:hypothetical protein
LEGKTCQISKKKKKILFLINLFFWVCISNWIILEARGVKKNILQAFVLHFQQSSANLLPFNANFL